MSSPLTWATTSGTPSRSASGISGISGCSGSAPASAEAVSSALGDSAESSSLGVQAVSARAAATQTARKERLMRIGRTPEDLGASEPPDGNPRTLKTALRESGVGIHPQNLADLHAPAATRTVETYRRGVEQFGSSPGS